MKIKRFFAPDIRQAMRMVREEQGPDAVILSNKRVNGGVEIVAAIDYDESMLPGQARSVPSPDAGPGIPRDAPPVPTPAAAPNASTVAPVDRSWTSSPVPVTAASTPLSRPAVMKNEPAPETTRSGQGADSVWSQEPTLVEMKAELNNLRRMLEGQLSSLAWGNFARGEPRRVELIQRLMQFGMTAAQCRSIVDAVATDEADADTLWRRALETITRGLPMYGHDILAKGGVVALVGPTGAGKTTTAAKLAAHFALRHGKRHVALVTIDNYRVGAYEQLRTYGRILDIPVRIADSRDELRSVLDDLGDRRLVLIDTSGMSQRDSGLSRQAEMLDKGDLRKRTLLVLPATNRHSGLDDVASAFSIFEPDACVLTKVDESTCLGGCLSAAVKHQIPIAWVSDGQRVPEDLHPAHADDLVARSVHIMNRTGSLINEDLVTLSFGREIANAHL